MEQPSLGFDEDEPEATTFSVVELNSLVRDALRRALPDEVWVRGEVQNLSRSGAGHTYFSLVEKAVRGDRVQGRLDVALFRDDRRAVDRALAEVPGAELGNDVEVRIRGRVTVYPPSGSLPAGDDGDRPGLHRRRDRRQPGAGAAGARGRGPARRQRPLASSPLVPLRVGLVTSAGSAAYHDFVHELERSGYAWQVGVVDVRVQGAAAARRIKWALGQLLAARRRRVVLVRGGGSRADLAPFDTELVARAIAAMPVPVITGVGHETDRSVADEVAHTACKTPTACAQLLVRPGATSSWARLDDAVATGDRRGRVSAWPWRRGSSTMRVGAARPSGPGAASPGARRARARPTGALDELAAGAPARRRRQLDGCARRVAELGRRATRDARPRARRPRARARDVGRRTTSIGRHSGSTRSEAVVRALDPASGARARLHHHPRRRRPGGAGGPPMLTPARSSRPSSPSGRVTSRVETHHGGCRSERRDRLRRRDARSWATSSRSSNATTSTSTCSPSGCKRASELIQLCRGRIARAQADVDRIVTDLEVVRARRQTPSRVSVVDADRSGQRFWPASLRFLNCAFT